MKNKLLLGAIIIAIGVIGVLVMTQKEQCTIDTIDTNCTIAEIKNMKNDTLNNKKVLEENIQSIESIEL